MIEGKKVMVVMPAYNAAATLERTYNETPAGLVDGVILVDDGSQDQTVSLAAELGIQVHQHAQNRGYGGNQKSCYRLALEAGADVVVMVHPDYQYSPRLIGAMAWMITSGHYEIVMASRILGGGALSGGMPRYKYVANRLLTAFQNLAIGAKLSEYHTGFRAFSAEALRTLKIDQLSEDFVFDNQIIGQAVFLGLPIGEVSCPTRYFEEASSISFSRSVRYGLGVLGTSLAFVGARLGLFRTPAFRSLERARYRSFRDGELLQAASVPAGAVHEAE